MSELTITTSQIQGDISVNVFHLEGHLHGATEKELVDRARQAYEDGARHLLLEISELEVLASAGLRAIQIIFKLFTPSDDVETMRKHGEEPYKSPYFKIVCAKPEIYYILNITGFLQNIFIYNNLEEATSSFGG
ncbi:MAG TPA: STAS domain-containing protein [Anaerolineales bacterium]|nr:STAS domain-containing protein [Anaerolineales bacterium]